VVVYTSNSSPPERQITIDFLTDNNNTNTNNNNDDDDDFDDDDNNNINNDNNNAKKKPRSNQSTVSRYLWYSMHGFGIIDWKKNELEIMDSKTRKLLTLNRMHHPRSDVDGLYLGRK
jgi:hypothetical protein